MRATIQLGILLTFFITQLAAAEDKHDADSSERFTATALQAQSLRLLGALGKKDLVTFEKGKMPEGIRARYRKLSGQDNLNEIPADKLREILNSGLELTPQELWVVATTLAPASASSACNYDGAGRPQLKRIAEILVLINEPTLIEFFPGTFPENLKKAYKTSTGKAHQGDSIPSSTLLVLYLQERSLALSPEEEKLVSAAVAIKTHEACMKRMTDKLRAQTKQMQNSIDWAQKRLKALEAQIAKEKTGENEDKLKEFERIEKNLEESLRSK